ncbi:MATE family efflux transporter [Alteraurantiacibacter aestuarii]|uniref:MATE family efflux transporter n=1 Tax=Alteraurantiacibacter aestuarii TaxID=650004 RepID=A0A844ZF94_9SPHN|nr:MATE family efflux transporter [Alteraurantiacibacter aestuarii]MXO87201.1 MATE family efflux transporter [Alteraurantiacibacter aestuarii]
MRPIAHPEPLGWKAECIETLRIAGPLALANLLQMLTYAIDVVFIARLGAAELAAASLSVSMFGLLVWALQGLTGSVAPVAAAELGARAPALRPIRRAVRMAMWLAVAGGVAVMIMCAQAERFMLLTGQDAHIAALAGDYMAVLIWAVVPMVMSGVMRNFVSTLGRPIFATLITALGIFVNALGNYALIFGNLGAPALGLEGAAIATVITSLAILAAYVIAIRIDPRLHRYHVFGFFWRPDWKRLMELVRIGTPIALTIVAEAGVFGGAAFLMGLIGAQQLAAHALAMQIAAMAFQVPQGVGQATTIRVGYYAGARENTGVRRAGWAGIAMGTCFMVLTASAMLLVPEYLLIIYIDPFSAENAALVGFATSFLVVGACFQLFDGLQVVALGALRGLKDTRVPMWIALFSYWVPGYGLAIGLGFFTPLGGVGVWIGLAAGLVFASGLLLRRWHQREVLGLISR